MLDWIFGSKKEEKQPESEQHKLGADQKWVYDFVKQYLTSPIWRNPLLDLIEENCVIFEDSEENKFQYTKVFQEFTGLAALLLETMIDETGINEKQLQKCIIKGMKHEKDRKVFQQIIICDNFEAFKKIMVSKNKELELEALTKLQADHAGGHHQGQIQIDAKELERLEIEKAIAMSLAMDSKSSANQDKELEEAIRMSQMQYEKEEKKKEEKKVEEKKVEEKKPEQKKDLPKKSHLGQLPPIVIGTSRGYKPVQEFKKEEDNLKAEIEGLKKKEQERRAKDEQDKETSEDRKKRLLEQRELIKKKKQEERKEQLTNFVENKQGAGNPLSENKISGEELERRKNLMKKLKQQLKD